MNLSIYGLGDERNRKWLAVDLGVSFAAEEHLPGVDLILPDIRYLIEERKNLAGLVLTHAHEDHFGAILDLWPQLKIPIYATPFTAALLEAKRAERARRAGGAGHGGAARRPLQRRRLRHRTGVDGAFDPGGQCADHPHAGRHRAAHRRLEDRPDADPRRRHRRKEAARAGRGGLSGAGRGFDQCGARRPLALGSRRGQNHRRTGEAARAAASP